MISDRALDFDNLKNCTGSGACKNICPVGAISITYNEQGFYVPVLDKFKYFKYTLLENIFIGRNRKKLIRKGSFTKTY